MNKVTDNLTKYKRRFKISLILNILLILLLIVIIKLGRTEIPNDYYELNSTFSPNGYYRTIAYRISGGGAAGYCDVYLSVVPSDKYDYFRKAKYGVLTLYDCDAKVQVNWKSNKEIDVVYTGEIYKKSDLSFDGQVSINFKR